MKCAYHPNKEATAQCSQCKKYLCDECSLSDGEKSVVCSRCAALKAAQDAVYDVDQQIEEKEKKEHDMGYISMAYTFYLHDRHYHAVSQIDFLL